MPKKRWHMGAREPLTAAVGHFLVTGCYWSGPTTVGTGSGFDFACFMMAHDISQRRSGPLRLLWATYHDALPVPPGCPSFAETVLSGGTWPWPETPWRCSWHLDLRPGAVR